MRQRIFRSSIVYSERLLVSEWIIMAVCEAIAAAAAATTTTTTMMQPLKHAVDDDEKFGECVIVNAVGGHSVAAMVMLIATIGNCMTSIINRCSVKC